jgi:phosphoserine phosphatase
MSFVVSLGRLISVDDWDNSILIVDLDETLINCNSFPLWVRYCLCFGNLRLKIGAASILFQRKILRYSHAKTKNNLQKLWAKFTSEKDLENLIAALQQKINPVFVEALKDIKIGKVDAILATSAAAIYARGFAEKIGFKHILATEIDGEENRADEKARKVLESIAEKGWENRKKIFCTDHLEDLPLMLASDKIIWFGSENDMKFLRENYSQLDITNA